MSIQYPIHIPSTVTQIVTIQLSTAPLRQKWGRWTVPAPLMFIRRLYASGYRFLRCVLVLLWIFYILIVYIGADNLRIWRTSTPSQTHFKAKMRSVVVGSQLDVGVWLGSRFDCVNPKEISPIIHLTELRVGYSLWIRWEDNCFVHSSCMSMCS